MSDKNQTSSKHQKLSGEKKKQKVSVKNNKIKKRKSA